MISPLLNGVTIDNSFAPEFKNLTVDITRVIIQGSSRSNRNTRKVLLFVKERTGFQVVDLKSKILAHLIMITKKS